MKLLLFQFNKNSVTRLWMNESHERSAFSLPRSLVNQLCAFLLQSCQLRLQILHRKTDVVDGLAFLFQKPGHATVRIRGLDKLDVR